MLFPALHEPPDRAALRFGDRRVSYAELRDAAAAVAERVHGARRVAVWAVNEPEVVAAVAGALAAGVPVVPINPKAGERELGHILADSEPELVLVPPGLDPPVPGPVAVDLGARGGDLPGGAGAGNGRLAIPQDEDRRIGSIFDHRQRIMRHVAPDRQIASKTDGARARNDETQPAPMWTRFIG